MIAPHLEEMDKTMDDVVFLKVDVDECEDLAQEYKVIFIFVCRLNVNITKYTLVDAWIDDPSRRKVFTPNFSSSEI